MVAFSQTPLRNVHYTVRREHSPQTYRSRGEVAILQAPPSSDRPADLNRACVSDVRTSMVVIIALLFRLSPSHRNINVSEDGSETAD